MKNPLNKSIWGNSIAVTVLVVRDQICALTLMLMFFNLSLSSLLYFPCRPNLVLSELNAKCPGLCHRCCFTVRAISTHCLGRGNVTDMFCPCWLGSGSEICVIPEAKPPWQGLQENQRYCLTQLHAQTSWFKWSDAKARAEADVTQVLGKVWDSFPWVPALSQENVSDVCALCQKLGGLLAVEMGFSCQAAVSHLLANTGHLISFREEKL